ncbi:MAG: trans-2,3-dihydro-3-hydroxyanthranilate isomerase [Gaiellales bacterium]|nr:trans-2,3-dihydro-3-hydroxyanthranilate isomerase [Gaiellales bacterium]
MELRHERVTTHRLIPEVPAWHRAAEAVHPYFVVDVFSSRPLEGNQLAVFEDGRPFLDDQLQAVAREMNFPETVFLLPAEQGGDLRVRIFTPGKEMAFAGHPVLGTSFVVGAALGKERITLETGMGLVEVALERDRDRVVFGRMQQPVPTWSAFDRPGDLLRAIGVESSGLPVTVYDNGARHVFVQLASEDAVAALTPDLSALARFDYGVNCFAGAGSSWKTRMFAPAWGIPEDPATGSAAGPLAVHLARHGLVAFGEQIEIRQGVEILRPSVLFARAEGASARVERVEVGGAAVVVSHGEYLVEGHAAA